MDRRVFLGAGTTLPLLVSQAQALGQDDIFIEEVKPRFMRGFPPAVNECIQAKDLHSPDDKKRVWAQQHIQELCHTQSLSRGSGQVSVLPRRMENLDALQVQMDGQEVDLSELLRKTFTDAFLVLHRGKIVTEKYFNGMRPEVPHLIWSCSKSISAGVVANLMQQHKEFTRDAPVTKFVPQLRGCGYDGCTVGDLLDMRSCVKYRFGSNAKDIRRDTSDNECGKHYRSARMYPALPGENFNGQYDFLQSIVKDPKLEPHGSLFCYKDSDTAVLAWVCEMLTKRRFADLVSDLIWSRLGAEHDASMVCGPQGGATPAAGMSVTVRDFARWGQMHLNLGKWNGQQVVPASYIQDLRKFREPLLFGDASYPPADGFPQEKITYYNQFWIDRSDEEAFWGIGHCGQYCYINFTRDVVIVRFATEKELELQYQLLLGAFADIARALSPAKV